MTGNQKLSVKWPLFLYLSVYHVLNIQKNNLIETVLLSTQNICFGLELKMLRAEYSSMENSVCHITLHMTAINGLCYFKSLNDIITCNNLKIKKQFSYQTIHYWTYSKKDYSSKEP